MSEYQYYEFQAIDRSLTETQMAELRRISSRAQITRSSFINVYNYGNFRGDPDTFMQKYFDAFLHVANWGTHWLMFRVPKELLPVSELRAYCAGDVLTVRQASDGVVISFCSDDEASHEWEEGGGWLASLVQLRQDIVAGDLRALYLGWLLAVQEELLDGNALEPLVPAGLQNLGSSLTSLVNFLRIDSDLLKAASETSEELHGEQLFQAMLEQWISALSSSEKDELLAKAILNDEPLFASRLRKSVLQQLGTVEHENSHQRRTVSELVARADILAAERQGREAKKTCARKGKTRARSSHRS